MSGFMAVCPRCRENVNVNHVIAQDMACPRCATVLRFDRREHQRAARPGLSIAFAIIFNLYYTVDPFHRALISFVLLVAWFIFFKQYRNYLRSATLEEKQ